MLKNLEKAIAKLNRKDEEGYQEFNFKIRQQGNRIELYDAKENYNYDYEYHMNCLIRQCADEFGFEAKPYTDKIMPALEEAAQKDLGETAFIEWEDSVTMSVWA